MFLDLTAACSETSFSVNPERGRFLHLRGLRSALYIPHCPQYRRIFQYRQARSRFPSEFLPLCWNRRTSVGTDPDGDKIYHRYESKLIKGKWARTWNTKFGFLRGTGKYEGIKEGGGTSSTYHVAPNQSYEDWELEVEFPR